MALTRAGSGSGESSGGRVVQPPERRSTIHELSPTPVDEVGRKRWSRRATWALVGGLSLIFWVGVGWLVVTRLR